MLLASCVQPLTAEVDQALFLAAGLEARGHSCVWLGPPGSAGLRGAAGQGLASAAFPAPDFKRQPFHWIRNLTSLDRLLDRHEPDILFCIESPVHTIGAIAARGRRRPALVRWRGTALPVRGGPISRHLYGNLTRSVLVPCRKAVEQAASAGLDVGNWKVLSGCVDLVRFSPRPRDPAALGETGFGAEDRILALVARLAPVKGIDVFLEAVALTRHREPWVRALILGEAWEGQEARFHAAVAGLQLEGVVRWMGRREDVERWLSLAEVGIVSSIGSEMYSRAALEYLSSGLAVVATRVGVLPEWLEAQPFARLVPPGDPPALAAAIVEMLSRTDRGSLGGQARTFAAQHFSPEHFVAAAERLFLSALEAR